MLSAVAPQVDRIGIVDNTPLQERALGFVDILFPNNIQLFFEKQNVGVGTAHNRGIEWALREGATHVLLLDQDSVPDSAMVDQLLQGWQSLVDQDIPVSAVGPQYLNACNQRPSYCLKYEWFGTCRGSKLFELIETDFLISSGSLIPLDAIRMVGLIDEELFIDHVDTEWFLRAVAIGWRAYGVCQAVMHHSRGEKCLNLWLGSWFVIARYRPFRYYYIFRNSFLLYKRSYVPLRWVTSDLMRLVGLIIIHGLVSSHRLANLRMMFRGIVHGLKGQTGPLFNHECS